MKKIIFSIALFFFTVSPVSAVSTIIYNNIPNPLPGNLVSQAFEAQSASEFGGQIAFSGLERFNPKITVIMSSWGCETGHWYTGDCLTSPGSGFTEPITLNVYEVQSDDSPGLIITSLTKTFTIPFRPSVDSINCTGGRWFNTSENACYNGFATPISFDLTGITLPDKVIVSLAYNTTHYGYSPIGESTTCYISSGGCGYDSLNVGLSSPPSPGTNPLPNDAYINSTWSGAYCNGPTGSFRLDTGCWIGYQPSLKVEARLMHPNATDQCKKDGWMSFSDPTFKNQGDCVSYVQSNPKAVGNKLK